MAANPKNTPKGLHGLRDTALLLSMANTHLCEEVHLQKAGLAIDNHLKELKSEISLLKKKFPGQFVNEVDTAQLIDNIEEMVKGLQEPDKAILQKCRTGALGLELENGVDVIGHAIDVIRNQVEGNLGTYSKAESVMGRIGWIKSVGRRLYALSTLTVKLTGLVVLILLTVFTTLFLSMDSPQDLLNEVSQYRTHIQGRQQILSRAHAERKRISRELDMMDEDDFSRQEWTKIITLNLEIHEINERVFSAQAEIEAYQRRIDEMEKKIDEMNKKPFLRRLFRL